MIAVLLLQLHFSIHFSVALFYLQILDHGIYLHEAQHDITDSVGEEEASTELG